MAANNESKLPTQKRKLYYNLGDQNEIITREAKKYDKRSRRIKNT